MSEKKVIFIEDVSSLIGKSTNTIRTCHTNEHLKHLIPRPFKMPHSRRLCWYRDDVEAWIKSGGDVLQQRRRGRPTKRESIKTAAK